MELCVKEEGSETVHVPQRTTDEVDADVVECVDEVQTREEGYGRYEAADSEVVEGVEDWHFGGGIVGEGVNEVVGWSVDWLKCGRRQARYCR